MTETEDVEGSSGNSMDCGYVMLDGKLIPANPEAATKSSEIMIEFIRRSSERRSVELSKRFTCG